MTTTRAQNEAIFAKATPDGNQMLSRLVLALIRRLYLLAPIVRFVPSLRWRGTLYAFSYEAVQNVLGNDAVFPVPFTQRMASLDRTGALSILGFDNDADYRSNLCQIMRNMPIQGLTKVGHGVAAEAQARVAAANGRLDAIKDLMTPIMLMVAQNYFGIRFKNEQAFHRWTMAISNYTFTGPNPPSKLSTAAHAGGRLMDAELDTAITAARQNPPTGNAPGNFLQGLAAMATPGGQPALSHDQIRATIAGLLTGFMPNLPVAGYNVLQLLLDRPDAMRIAREAALADDDALLERCIMEALRLRPIDPGRRRLCAGPAATGVRPPGPLRGRRSPPERVYAMTLWAMCDAQHVRKPRSFDPERPLSDNMALGFGKHFCVGAPIAMCILVHALKPLLRQPGLRRTRLAEPTFLFLGFFPENLDLCFG